MRGGLLVQRRHGPTPRCEVSGIDNSEGGHPRAHVWARGLWVLGREPWRSIHLSKPMLGKSPRSTANTCGVRPTWRVFQPIVRVAFLRHTLCEPSHVSVKTLRLSTHNLGLVVLEWVKRLWSSQNHMPNSMQGSLSFLDPLTHLYLTGMPGHSALRSSPGSITEDEFKEEASNLAFAFWDRIGEFLKRSRTCSELSPDEKTLWIQSGLALSSTSNKVTGRQSLSSNTKLIPGNAATKAARTKVPAQVKCT